MESLTAAASEHPTYTAVALCLAAIALVHKAQGDRLSHPLPPGPKPNPILGNYIPSALYVLYF